MPASGLLTLLDDIATMSKVAASKTVGISGDDLAVNSQALSGVDPKRELPIVWEVAKGSLKNKAMLIPAALGLSLAAPWAITPLLTMGGIYLCYEGIEKVLHRNHGNIGVDEKPKGTPAEIERGKIKSAIRTDLILSAEIVVVTLGAVAASPFITQVAVLGGIGLGMTAGIYGLVGGLLRLDDLGASMMKKQGDSAFSKSIRSLGRGLVKSVPPLMKGISVLGTGAMFMVGGGLMLHGIPAAAHGLQHLAHTISSTPAVADMIEMAVATVAGAAAGLAAMPVIEHIGKPLANLVTAAKKLFKTKPAKTANDNGAVIAAPETPGSALKNVTPLRQSMAAALKTPETQPDAATAQKRPAPKP